MPAQLQAELHRPLTPYGVNGEGTLARTGNSVARRTPHVQNIGMAQIDWDSPPASSEIAAMFIREGVGVPNDVRTTCPPRIRAEVVFVRGVRAW